MVIHKNSLIYHISGLLLVKLLLLFVLWKIAFSEPMPAKVRKEAIGHVLLSG